jgi:hypothetical protein
VAATFLLDLIDTRLKGVDYFQSLGVQYLARNLSYVTLSVVAVLVKNRTFHAILVTCALVYLVVWMVQRYSILS